MAAVIGRRSFLIGSALVGLTACGDDASSTKAPPREVRVTGDGYDLTVPASPSRVVVMEGRGDLDFAVTGDYPIVATGNTGAPGTLPAGQYEGRLPAGAVSIGGADGPGAEEVLAQRPDLIIMRANGYRKDFYGNEKLAKIAPILPVEVNESDFVAQAKRQFQELDRMNSVQSKIDDYTALVENAKRDLGDALVGRRIALLTSQPIGKGYVNVWTDQLGTTVAADLGMTVVKRDTADDDGEEKLSVENLGQLAAADFILHQTSEPAAVEAVPTWRTLPAVAAGRSAVLDPRLNNGLLITATAVAQRIVEVVRQG